MYQSIIGEGNFANYDYVLSNANQMAKEKNIVDIIGKVVLIDYVTGRNEKKSIMGKVIDYSQRTGVLLETKEGEREFVPLISLEASISDICLFDEGHVIYRNSRIYPGYNIYNKSRYERDKFVVDIDVLKALDYVCDIRRVSVIPLLN